MKNKFLKMIPAGALVLAPLVTADLAKAWACMEPQQLAQKTNDTKSNMSSFVRKLKDMFSKNPFDDPEGIIVKFKDKESYNKYLSELIQHNIIPYKRIKSINVLYFFVKPDKLNDGLRILEEEPNVESIEIGY